MQLCPHCGGDIYSPNKVRNTEIVAAIKAGATNVSQAKKYGLSPSTIANIRWKALCAPGESVRQYRKRKQLDAILEVSWTVDLDPDKIQVDVPGFDSVFCKDSET